MTWQYRTWGDDPHPLHHNFFVFQPLSCDLAVYMDSSCILNDVWDGSGASSAINAAFDI